MVLPGKALAPTTTGGLVSGTTVSVAKVVSNPPAMVSRCALMVVPFASVDVPRTVRAPRRMGLLITGTAVVPPAGRVPEALFALILEVPLPLAVAVAVTLMLGGMPLGPRLHAPPATVVSPA